MNDSENYKKISQRFLEEGFLIREGFGTIKFADYGAVMTNRGDVVFPLEFFWQLDEEKQKHFYQVVFRGEASFVVPCLINGEQKICFAFPPGKLLNN